MKQEKLANDFSERELQEIFKNSGELTATRMLKYLKDLHSNRLYNKTLAKDVARAEAAKLKHRRVNPNNRR